MKKLFNLRNTVIFVSFSVLWKGFLSAVLCLHADEAYYWLWSTKLQLSYYDHAPMVAYFIKLTTLFGNSEFFVRFSSIIATVLLSILLWKLVKSIFNDEQVASASVIILHSMPILFSASIIITPDTPSFLFLSFATFYVWKLISSENSNNWLLIGLFFGLSLLSKYTAILFLGSLSVYIILMNKYSWLKEYKLYVGMIIAFICSMPVLYWNYANDWISFAYQFGHGLSNKGIRFNYIFEYLGSQAGIFNVFLWIPAFIVSIKWLFSRQKEKVFLASFSVIVILFYAFTALKKLPGANWPIPAYFTFSIITAKYFLEGRSFKQKLLVFSICFNVVLSILVGLHAKYTVLPLDKISSKTAIADATNYFHGYKELADKIADENIKFVLAPSHQLAASIAYYARETVTAHAFSNSRKKSQFDMWQAPKDFDYNCKCAFVYEPEDDGSMPYDAGIFFNTVSDEVIEQTTTRNNNIARRYHIRLTSGKKI